MLVDGLDHRGAEEQEVEVVGGGVARLEQVVAGVGPHRPVVVLARAVHARERLLVQQADEAVLAGHALHHLHRQLLVIGADVRVLEDRRDLVLGRRHLVVTRLDRHAQLGQLELGVHHEREHALGDRPEVVVVQLVALGRLGAEQRAPGADQIGALEVVLLVDQEVLLLRPDRGEHARGLLVAEQVQGADRGARERVHRAQQRDLGVERLARPRRERGRDAEQRAVRVLEDERRAGGIPGGVAARLERGAHAARRERRGVRLALDQLLAREVGERDAVTGGAEERVVLLGGQAGQRLEDVRVVGGALLERPLLHAEGDRVGERRVERRALLQHELEPLEGLLGQAMPLNGHGEDVLPVRIAGRNGQVDGSERPSVGAPARGGYVGLTDSGHR